MSRGQGGRQHSYWWRRQSGVGNALSCLIRQAAPRIASRLSSLSPSSVTASRRSVSLRDAASNRTKVGAWWDCPSLVQNPHRDDSC